MSHVDMELTILGFVSFSVVFANVSADAPLIPV
jgi:hypothetical protein